MAGQVLPELRVGFEYRVRCFVSAAHQTAAPGGPPPEAHLRPQALVLRLRVDAHDFQAQVGGRPPSSACRQYAPLSRAGCHGVSSFSRARACI